MKKNEARGPKEHRPFIADECDNLHDAEKWRRELVGDLAKLISQIQNGADRHQIDW